MRKRDEMEEFRQGCHDFERRHGMRVTPTRKPVFGQQTGKKVRRRRLSPRSWHDRFVTALERTGDQRSAATMAGVGYGTARNDISRLLSLRERCQTAEAAYARRMLTQLAKGQIGRWELSPCKARALLILMRDEEQA